MSYYVFICAARATGEPERFDLLLLLLLLSCLSWYVFICGASTRWLLCGKLFNYIHTHTHIHTHTYIYIYIIYIYVYIYMYIYQFALHHRNITTPHIHHALIGEPTPVLLGVIMYIFWNLLPVFFPLSICFASEWVYQENRKKHVKAKEAIHAAGNLRQDEGPSTRNMCMWVLFSTTVNSYLLDHSSCSPRDDWSKKKSFQLYF